MKKQHFAGIHWTFVAIIMIAFASTLSACTYTLNWRDVSFGDDDFQALLPCKPDRAQRRVALQPGEAELPMRMMGCEAGGAMYTLARIDATDAAQAARLLQVWPRATQQAQAIAQPITTAASGVVTLRGASGGKPSVSRYEARGTKVYQAAILGIPNNRADGPSALATEAEATFLGGIRWGRP
jgi:hypothetical protein